ncbi:MAG TPA: EamA family transporter [Nevskiaceae bacterium]|nr:EamA family transporter [Nevskiaceae bacterium]
MTASRSRILLAFAIVYLVWGSTYLAIRVMVEVLPPLLSAGLRFLFAAALLLGYCFWRGDRLPRGAANWRHLALSGVLMLAAANGLVTWAEQWVDSNQAALIVATSALWLGWMGTRGPSGQALSPGTIAGLVLGFGGVALLVGEGLGAGLAPWQAYVGLQVSSLCWAFGSIYSKRHPVQAPPLMTASLQMLVAGLLMSALGLLHGDLARWRWELEPLLALAYLTVLGSCLAYGCYFWLVHQVTPAQLGTYAYVNPAVAVLLGWWWLDERLGPLQVIGTLVILLGVVLVTLSSRPPRPAPAR